MNFLVAYDITDPKRLRAVAKVLERNGRRVQKSLFVFTGKRSDLDGVLALVVALIDPGQDRVQAWPIRVSNRVQRIDHGNCMPETCVAAVLGNHSWSMIEAIDDDGEGDDEALTIDD